MDYGEKKVEKFVIDDPADNIKYRRILNSETCKVYKEEFGYDKFGNALVTVWWIDEGDEDE